MSDDVHDDEFVDEFAALVERIALLDGDDRIAAACRGSANPAALRWLAETLELGTTHRVLDVGAGLGGPAAWMRARTGCGIVAADPSPAAAAGARRLFGLPSVQAGAVASPFTGGAFDAVLLLGVLPVVDDRLDVLCEAGRVGRRLGVLDFCATSADTVSAGGSDFPAPEHVLAELRRVSERVEVVRIDEPTPATWDRAARRAHAGVPHPSSEREVIDAIESGRLALYAFTAR